jgi:hypothetical protein
MRTTSEEGLLLEAKIVCNGRYYQLICRIEECEPFVYGSFRNIDQALKGMTMFQLDRKSYQY